MSNDTSRSDDKRPQIGGEMIIPFAALIFTLYYFSSIVDSPWTAQVNAYIVGSILIAVIAVFFFTRFIMLIRGEATLSASSILAPYHILGKRAAFAGLTLGYLVAINWLGFTLTTFLFLFLSMVLLNDGKRLLISGFIASVMSAIGYGVFIYFFDTRLPKGLVEKILAGILQ